MPEKIRDFNADYRRALLECIAIHGPSKHTSVLLAELDAREGRVAHTAPGSDELEHKAEDAPDESAVPRRPGRPRKPSDADRV